MSDASIPPESTASVVGTVIGDVALAAANVFIPAGTVQDIIKLAAQYGPPAFYSVLGLLKKDAVTIADVESAFAFLKPYDSYGIPDKVPVTT